MIKIQLLKGKFKVPGLVWRYINIVTNDNVM